MSMNMGTWMVAPVSSVAGFVPPWTVSPLKLEADELIARIQQRDFVVLLEPL